MIPYEIPYTCHLCDKEFEFNSEFIKTDWAKYQNKVGYPVCNTCYRKEIEK